MTTPHRLSVKFFVTDPGSVEPSAFTPLFHRWIQTSAVEGLLIDVADYAHVPSGPGVVLVGHEVDYAMDLAGGRPGLLLVRKRIAPGSAALRDLLAGALRSAAVAASVMRADPALAGKLSFRADEAEVTILDRLRFPNTAAAFETVRGELAAALTGLGVDRSPSIDRGDPDPRRALGLRVHGPGAFAKLLAGPATVKA
jgi:hypothetical protein